MPLELPALKQPSYDFESAKKLPPEILFGTSSWTYPGWRGSIYRKEYTTDRKFRAESLAEYSLFPWFRTVGIDSFFYSPPTRAILECYASQVPEHFQWASKVWEEITIPQYAKHARYGNRSGMRNPNFLNVDLFCERVLRPHEVPHIQIHTGPFIFEFQTLGKEFTEEPDRFFEQLDTFFSRLPKDFRYAVELRNKNLLLPGYFQTLNRHMVSHCFNHWTRMPPLREQMHAAAQAGGIAAHFFIARLLTPIGVSYEDAVEMFTPYAEVQVPLPEMRRDVVRLAKRALARHIPVFVLVNNRLEGHAPGTIDAIGRMIIEQLRRNMA